MSVIRIGFQLPSSSRASITHIARGTGGSPREHQPGRGRKHPGGLCELRPSAHRAAESSDSADEGWR